MADELQLNSCRSRPRPARFGQPGRRRGSSDSSRRTAFQGALTALRDWHDGNHPGYVLGCWLRGYAGQVWLFTREAP